MPCDIKRLTKDELAVFIRAIPKKGYRGFGPKELLPKGFNNIENVPDPMFFNKVKSLLESDQAFVMNFNKFLDTQLALKQKKIKEFEGQGYDHVSAYAKLMEEDFDEEYRALFLKVFGESEDSIKAIMRSIEENGSLETRIRAMIETMLPSPDGRIDVLTREIKRLNEEIARVIKAQREIKEEKKTIEEQFNDYASGIAVRMSSLDQGLNNLSSSLKKAILDLEKKIISQGKLQPAADSVNIKAVKEELESLSNQLRIVQQTLAESSTISPQPAEQSKSSPFEVMTVFGPGDVDYNDEEYLDDNILDVALGRIRQETSDVYRSAMHEYIYQGKPIISAGKSAIHLVEEISGVLTGRVYYRVKLNERDFSFGDLLSVLENICSENEPTVVLIENVLGRGDLNPLIRRMRDVVPNARIVFSMPETRFIKFLDPSLFEQCLYFGGDFNDAESPYLYVTTISQKDLIPSDLFASFKESLGLGSTFSSSLVGNDFSGLVSYCLIPYLVDHEQMNLSDAIARIDDDELRQKCKEALNA